MPVACMHTTGLKVFPQLLLDIKSVAERPKHSQIGHLTA